MPSERALRPCAVFRKITIGFRTERGAKLYADIRSVIETARRRSIGALEAIRLALAGAPLADSTWPQEREQLRRWLRRQECEDSDDRAK